MATNYDYFSPSSAAHFAVSHENNFLHHSPNRSVILSFSFKDRGREIRHRVILEISCQWLSV